MGAAGSIGEDVADMKHKLAENMKASMSNFGLNLGEDSPSHRSDLEAQGTAHMGKIQREMLLETFHALCKKHKTTELNKGQLREVFPMVDDAMFDTLYRFFDKNGDGSVDVKEFVVTLGMLLHSTNIDDRIHLAFAMFDTDGNRSLDKDEFRAMMKATLAPSMELLLKTTVGVESFREFLQFEYAVENLEFWQAAGAFQTAKVVDMDVGRLILRKYIIDGTYIDPETGEEKPTTPVNIRGDQRERIVAAFAKAEETATAAAAAEEEEDAAAKTGLVPQDVFAEAKGEVYELLEKDNFARFQKTRGSVDEMVDNFFHHIDENNSGAIDMEEFKTWAQRNPDSLNLLQSLGAGSWLALSETQKRELDKGDGEGISKEDVLVDKGKHSRIAHEIMSADGVGSPVNDHATLNSRVAGSPLPLAREPGGRR